MGKTVWVAGDNPEMQRLVQAMATEVEGLYVVMFARPTRLISELIRVPKASRPSLVVVDSELPDIDGLKAAKIIGEVVPGLPVVLISSADWPRDAPVAAALRKPCLDKAFVATVRIFLQN